MLQKNVKDLLMDQINKELYSAYLYVEFANYYEDQGLSGFAYWYMNQADEEVGHAKKIRQYLIDNEERVTLEKIDKPDKVFKNISEPLAAGLEHEKYVTSLIHNIYGEALKVGDYRTMYFLQWFIDEQQEEEINANDNVTKMKLYGGDPAGLYELDKVMGKRKE